MNASTLTKPVLGYGVTPLAEIAAISGLDFIRGIVEGKIKAPPIAEGLKYEMFEATEGSCVFKCFPGIEHLNPLGTVHGGYIATVMDSALACAVQTLCPIGYASTSIDLKINFVRPLLADSGPLYARAKVVHPGRQIATAEGRLEDAEGKLYAHGSQACSVFKIPV